MRSRRRRLELGCRIAAFAVLGWLIGASLVPAGDRSAERATSRDIGERLAGWTRLPSAVALHADFPIAPDPYIADWLGALRRAGHAVAWSGAPPAVTIAADALADPAGGLRIDVAAPSGTDVTIRDAASAIDSVRVAALGATMTASIAVDSIVAETRGQRFSAPVPERAQVRAALVVGQAGWEGKFVARALEERGWTVIARFGVAPRVDVTQGAAAPLDTSRISVVIAIDSTIESLGGGAAALERFVREGGGLVLVGAAGSSRAVASLAPGSLGPRTRPALLPTDTIGLGATGFYRVRSRAPHAPALAQRGGGGGVAVAARRVGAGRVLQVGYDDSWRWRMAGGPGSEAAHRRWWSRVAASVAYVPVGGSAGREGSGAEAPVAHLVDRIGPARAPVQRPGSRRVDSRILMAIIMILLLTEWGSRRLRGLA